MNTAQKPLVFTFVLRALLVLSLVFQSTISMAGEKPNAKILDKVAVVVDNTPILLSELKHATQRAKKSLQTNNQTVDMSLLKKQVLNNLINKVVQTNAAKQRGITIDNAIVSEEILNIAKRNNLSLAQLKNNIEAEGTPFSEFREIIKHQLLIQRTLQAEVFRKIRVSEQDIDDYLTEQNLTSDKQFFIQHILLSVAPDSSEKQIQATRKEADELIEKINAGRDFSQLAKQYSQGQNASNGGEMGWFNVNNAPSLFTQALKTMDKGDVSPIIQSPNGFHIIKIAETKGENRIIVKQAKVRHILITPNLINNEADVREQINQLRARILKGENFSVLAKVYSDDSSASQGGELDWSNPNTYVPSFQKAVDTLPLNTLSTPIHTKFGWHLLEVLERRDYDQTRLQRRYEARVKIQEKRAKEAQDVWLAKLRDEAYIDYRIPSLKLPSL